jgi:hypothetical protein
MNLGNTKISSGKFGAIVGTPIQSLTLISHDIGMVTDLTEDAPSSIRSSRCITSRETDPALSQTKNPRRKQIVVVDATRGEALNHLPNRRRLEKRLIPPY